MAIKRQNRFLSQQRLTVPVMKAIESGMCSDFDDLLRGFFAGSSNPYVIRGFFLNILGNSFTQTADNLTINTIDSGILHVKGTESGTLLIVNGNAGDSLSATNSKVKGSFVAGATNYISLSLVRTADPNSVDTIVLWDVNSSTERPKLIPTATILDYRINISTTGFSDNLPIATVTTNAGNIPTSIVDSRNLIFRLGTGGAVPNPLYSYGWVSGRTEPPIISTNPLQNPFAGADKQINTMKEWMDAVMTSIKEIKGTPYWFSVGGGGGASGLSLLSVNDDANLSELTGTGYFTHDSVTVGQLSVTSDIYIRNIVTDSYFRIEQFTKTLTDGQVLYISILRYKVITGNVIIQPGAVPPAVLAAAGGNLARIFQVTAVGQFSPLVANSAGAGKGDFVRSQNDDNRYFRQIEEFYDALGAISTAANATYLVLDAAYTGSNGAQSILYNKTFYSALTDVTVANKISVLGLTNLENVYWLALRQGNLIYIKHMGEMEPGEIRYISDNTTVNILNYIGSPLEATSSPTYSSTITGGVTAPSQTNYPGALGDNLTTRVSLISTAAADQAQNKNITLLGGGTVANAAGNISWDSTATFVINGPGAGTLNTMLAGNITVPVNGCAYVTIDRNNNSVLTASTSTFAALPLTENTYVFARRLSTADVWVGLDGFSHLIADGTNNSTGFNSASIGTIGAANFHSWRQELPASGAINGINKIFTFNSTPYSAGGFCLFKNGLFQIQDPTIDYSIVGNTVTFKTAPLVGSEIVAQMPVGKTIPYSYVQQNVTVVALTPNYTLSVAPGNVKGVAVFINGLLRRYGTDFSIVGVNVTFTFNPSIGSIITFFYTTSNDNLFGDQMECLPVPNGTREFFTYHQDIKNPNGAFVAIDGVAQFPIMNSVGNTSYTNPYDYYWVGFNGIKTYQVPPLGAFVYTWGR